MVEPFKEDFRTRIINVGWGSKVYVVISGADGAFAQALKKGVNVLDQQSTPFGGSTAFLTGTLLECPANAGADFALLSTITTGGSGGQGGGTGSTFPTIFVYPRTAEVRALWWAYTRDFFGQGNAEAGIFESAPYLWIAGSKTFSPVTVKFKIEKVPHLIGVPPDAPFNTIVRAYPTTGVSNGPGGNNEPASCTGYGIVGYRTEKAGTGVKYFGASHQPLWATDPVIVDDGVVEGLGLLFGRSPPLIASDIPES